MIETDTVERVQKSKTALDLVRLDHALENVMDGDVFALAGEVVGDGENGAQVVRGMPPLGGQEAVIVVQPPNLSADVESTADRVELVVGAGDLRACSPARLSLYPPARG